MRLLYHTGGPAPNPMRRGHRALPSRPMTDRDASEPSSDQGEKKKKKKKKKRKGPKERTESSRHSVEIDGALLEYTATAGTLFLRGPDDTPRASVFYVAYTADHRGDPAERPITFAFNGGPGSSSVWLQLGALGPRRALVTDAGPNRSGAPRLAPNECSILDVTDLVFIDPVGTGYSRALGETEAKEFHTVKEDVRSIAEFIRRYTTRHRRWTSPRFIAGESYGTTRAAALAAHMSQHGAMVDGLVLVSAALMFQSFVFEAGIDLPYVLYLPAYTATAAFHGRLDPAPSDLRAFLAEAERFAVEEYQPALTLGAALDPDRRTRLAGRLSELSGLPAALWLERDLRVDLPTFCRELLRGEGRIVGRLDARFTGLLSNPSDDPGAEDPSLFYPYGPYTALMQDYLARELGYAEERPYNILSFEVNQGWRWSDENKPVGFINATPDLRRAMIENPALSVFFGSGLYDLATPYFASMHTARHLGREPQITAQITEAFYDAGHMMYLHEASRRKLRDDLVQFYRAALD